MLSRAKMLYAVFAPKKLISYVQNPLDTFPRSFPIDGEVANLLRTCYRHGKLSWRGKMSLTVRSKLTTSLLCRCTGIIRKRHNTTGANDQLWSDLLRENWCNGFWP